MQLRLSIGCNKALHFVDRIRAARNANEPTNHNKATQAINFEIIIELAFANRYYTCIGYYIIYR